MHTMPADARRGQWSPWNWSYRWPWALGQELRMEPWPSGRAASALSSRHTPPALKPPIYISLQSSILTYRIDGFSPFILWLAAQCLFCPQQDYKLNKSQISGSFPSPGGPTPTPIYCCCFVLRQVPQVVQIGLQLYMWPRIILNSWSFCFYHLSDRITGMCYLILFMGCWVSNPRPCAY